MVPIPVKPEERTFKRLPVEPTNRVEVAIREPVVVVAEIRALP